MSSENIENYVGAIGESLRELALEAKADLQAAKGTPEENYKTGYLMGFHRVLTLMQQEANLVFSVPMDKIGLDGFDADEDLF